MPGNIRKLSGHDGMTIGEAYLVADQMTGARRRGKEPVAVVEIDRFDIGTKD
jgi:hypothetical protein